MSRPEKALNKEEKSPAVQQIEPEVPKSVIREYFESFVVTLIMAIFGMTFIVQAVTVPTGSMQNTIMIGDNLLVNKFIFAPGYKLPFLPQRDIQRGDIIVFKYPGNKVHPGNDSSRNIIPYATSYVKRVIGLPGDTVEFRNNQVFINNELLPENRITAKDLTNQDAALNVKETPPRQQDEKYSVYYLEGSMEKVKAGLPIEHNGYEFAIPGKPMKVPENSYFAMGDSRDVSEDSRFWGFVDRDLIIGRAMFVYYSYDKGAPTQGNFVSDFIFNSRWSRIGTMIK